MATNLGKKHSCYSCQTKFYDLGKPAAICPKCGADQRNAEDAPTTGRSRRAPVVVEAPPVVEDEFEEESEEIASDDEEELAPAAADAEEDDDEDEFEE